MRNIKNVNRIALTLVTICSLVGCATNQNDKPSVRPDMPVYEKNGTFRLGNWGVPPRENTGYGVYADNPNYSTLENWQTMANCGYNLVVPTNGFSVQDNLHELEMAEKVGLNLLIRDRTTYGFETIINYCVSKGYNYRQCFDYVSSVGENIKANIEQYKQYKSFIGVNAFDEPSTDYYDAIAACQDWFYINYPTYEFYTNLLPVYATGKQLFGTSSNKGYGYEDYVSQYRENVNPAMLSYDHYPILIDYDESLYIKEDFLYNLNVFAQQAKKANVPAYIYIQTMGFYNNAPVTTYEEFAWQVYTSLAFGVKGILTFMYWTQLQEESLNNVRHGIVERDGTKNEIYDVVQEVFGNVTKMEDVFMNYDWDGVKLVESGRVLNEQFEMINRSTTLDKLNDISSVKNSQDVVIGQFKNKNNEYAYMVTNVASPWDHETSKTELKFDNYDYVMTIEKGERKIVDLKDHVLTLDIKCGDGIFVVPVK